MNQVIVSIGLSPPSGGAITDRVKGPRGSPPWFHPLEGWWNNLSLCQRKNIQLTFNSWMVTQNHEDSEQLITFLSRHLVMAIFTICHCNCGTLNQWFSSWMLCSMLWANFGPWTTHYTILELCLSSCGFEMDYQLEIISQWKMVVRRKTWTSTVQ